MNYMIMGHHGLFRPRRLDFIYRSLAMPQYFYLSSGLNIEIFDVEPC